MEINKEILDHEITDYYESVKDMFYYRLKNEWKFIVSKLLYTLSITWIILNILPFIPYFSLKHQNELYDLILENIPIKKIEPTFINLWVIGVILSLILFIIILPVYKYWSKKEKKKALDQKYMNFCYAFTLRKEIKSFLINKNENHLEKSLQYFNKITQWIINAQITSETSTIFVKLVKLKNDLKEQFEWFELTENTINIINAYNGIDRKVINRLQNKIEIDKLLSLIDLLTLYHFCIINSSAIYNGNDRIGNYKKVFIECFAKELAVIDEYKPLNETLNKKINLKNFTQYLNTLLYNSNIFILFICWLTIITLAFIPLAMLIIHVCSVVIDSTIVITLITTPFLGAITFTATIFSKNNK